MSDKSFLNRILLACGRGPVRLWRMNVGQGWIGQATHFTRSGSVRVDPGDVLIKKARPFHSGIPGMGDLQGWKSVEVTPDMVGQRVAIIVSLEAKEGSGRLSPAQKNWDIEVRAAGGISSEIRSVEQAEQLLGFR